MFRKPFALAFCLAIVSATATRAATPGYVDDFNGGVGNWGGGSEIVETLLGGVDGPADAYLRIANEFFIENNTKLGVRNTQPVYTGDLIADGVTGFEVSLKDVGTDEDFEIRFGVGSAFSNFWVSSAFLNPSETEWETLSVDITDASGWVQVLGSGTFEDAIAASDRILIRHDLAPVANPPEDIVGDLGIDNVRVLPEPITGLALLAGGLVAIRRRRR